MARPWLSPTGWFNANYLSHYPIELEHHVSSMLSIEPEPLCGPESQSAGSSLRFHGGLLHFRNFCYHFELKLPPPDLLFTLPHHILRVDSIRHPPPFCLIVCVCVCCVCVCVDAICWFILHNIAELKIASVIAISALGGAGSREPAARSIERNLPTAP